MARRSDKIKVEGKLSEGFGNFSASMYSAKILEINRSAGADIMLDFRDWFSGKISASISEPASSLGAGFLLGQKRALSVDLEEALRVVGLTHIVVASGYNLTILVRFARRIFARRSRKLAILISAFLILAFANITGFSPSMTCACLVSLLSLWAWSVGRNFHPVSLLLFAAAGTTLINPSYIYANAGWQLSFGAFAGVMILAPLLQAYFFGNKKPSAIRQIFGETISASIATFPIIAFIFGKVSLISPLANLIIAPFVPLAMLLTFLSGLFTAILPNLAHVFGFLPQILLDTMIKIINFTASVPWAQNIYRWNFHFLWRANLAVRLFMEKNRFEIAGTIFGRISKLC